MKFFDAPPKPSVRMTFSPSVILSAAKSLKQDLSGSVRMLILRNLPIASILSLASVQIFGNAICVRDYRKPVNFCQQGMGTSFSEILPARKGEAPLCVRLYSMERCKHDKEAFSQVLDLNHQLVCTINFDLSAGTNHCARQPSEYGYAKDPWEDY